MTSQEDSASKAIKTMKLYTHLERIKRELKEAGRDGDASLDPEWLSKYDSLHYLGNDAVRRAIDQANITSESKVLDVGSGLGGPARMLAHWTGANVTALELQQDLHEQAAELSKQCNQSDKVEHACGNILEETMEGKFNAVVSWLVYLHITDRPKLFQKCADALVPEGIMYVEDFCCRDGATFTETELGLLAKEVYVPHVLPTWKVMQQELEDAGFELVECKDMTDLWRDYVKERFEGYKSELERHERVHGKESTEALLTFYDAVNTLFQGSALGGVSYTVRKKTTA